MKPLVSVVIVNWNTRELLRRCLRSLPWNSSEVALEAIVVDNDSADGSADMVERDFPQVRLIRNPENRHFVKANNQGLLAATGDYIFMLNSDAEARPRCIERLVRVAASDEKIGMVAPLLRYGDGTPQPSVGPFPRMFYFSMPTCIRRLYGAYYDGQRLGTTHLQRVEAVLGAAMLFPRSMLEAVGPMDERYVMWWDDTDWCQKIAAAGLDRVFVADAEVTHHLRQSASRQDQSILNEQLMESEYLYTRLHCGRAAASWAALWRMFRAWVALWLGRTKARRQSARWFLDLHKRNFRRWCLLPVPPEMPWDPQSAMAPHHARAVGQCALGGVDES